MALITYQQESGQVAILIPVDTSFTIEEIAARDVPFGCSYTIIDSVDIDDDYFDAYEFHPELGAEINIDKAKAIHLDKWRVARVPKLAALDVEFMRAVEKADTAKQAEIAAQKQALRDVTLTPLPDTLPEIKATWPEILS